MVVVGAVVGGAVVVGAVVVVGRGAAVVGGAVVGGRVLGGTVAAEVRGTADGGATTGSAARVELVVLDSFWVVSGVSTLLPPPAATALVVGAAQSGPAHAVGCPDPPNACNVRTTTIPVVATAVATHGRLPSQPTTPRSPHQGPADRLARVPGPEPATSGGSDKGTTPNPATSGGADGTGARNPATSGAAGTTGADGSAASGAGGAAGARESATPGC